MPALIPSRMKLIIPALALLGCVGCQTTVPRGDSGGRVDPMSSGTEPRTGEASTVTLLEFADQVKRDLPARLAAAPIIRDREYLCVIYMGEIVNRTFTSTTDFIAVRQIIQNGAINSSVLAEYANVFVDPSRSSRIRDRFTRSGGTTSNLVTGDDEMWVEIVGAGEFSPEDVFILDGEMSEIRRGGGAASTYVFDFKLVSAANGRIVFSSQVVTKEVQ